MKAREVCHCRAYKFPHRKDSAACKDLRDEREHADWLRNMSKQEALEWQKARDANVD